LNWDNGLALGGKVLTLQSLTMTRLKKRTVNREKDSQKLQPKSQNQAPKKGKKLQRKELRIHIGEANRNKASERLESITFTSWA